MLRPIPFDYRQEAAPRHVLSQRRRSDHWTRKAREQSYPARSVFKLKPKDIIETLDLLRPIYRKTAAYGHFGRELPEFNWERTDRVESLKKRAGI